MIDDEQRTTNNERIEVVGRLRALLALGLIVPAPTFGALMAFWVAPDHWIGKAAYVVGKLWLYGLPVAWLLWVERSKLSLSPARRGGFGAGVALGIAISIVIGLTYAIYPFDQADIERVRAALGTSGLATPARYIAMCAWLALVNAALEEYAFRWFIYRQFERLMRPWLAVIAAAAAFTLHHVIALRAHFGWDITVLASAGVFIGGLAWSWLYGRYRSIWPGYVSHLIVDVAIFIIGWDIAFGASAMIVDRS